MNYEEYVKKMKQVDDEVSELSKSHDKCFEELVKKRETIDDEYIKDNAPFEAKKGDVIEVKWHTRYKRSASLFRNVPEYRKHDIDEDTCYVERFLFNGWKFDKRYKMVVPIQCDMESRIGSGEEIVSIEKTKSDVCLTCEACEYLDFPGRICRKRSIYFSKNSQPCDLFLQLKILQKEIECKNGIKPFNLDEALRGATICLRNGIAAELDEVINDKVYVYANILYKKARIEYCLDGTFSKEENSSFRKFDLMMLDRHLKGGVE